MLYVDMIDIVCQPMSKGIIGWKKQVLISEKAMVATLVPSRQYSPTKAPNPLLESRLHAGLEGDLLSVLSRSFPTLRRINMSLHLSISSWKQSLRVTGLIILNH